MTPDEIEKAAHKGAAAGTKAALDEDRKKFYLEPKVHFKHHLFLDKIMNWSEKTTSTILGTVVKIIVYGVFSLLVLGAVTFVGKEILTSIGKEVIK